MKNESCEALCRDARTAGLNVAKIPAVLVG
jgi:hypothetical protein